MQSNDSKRILPAALWDERQLRPIHEGRWIERLNLSLKGNRFQSEYPYQLTVAINCDDSPEAADAGLKQAEQKIVAALTSDNLCIHALSYLGDDEWDLVFYTRLAESATKIIDNVQRSLPKVTLISEVVEDRNWDYYLNRLKIT